MAMRIAIGLWSWRRRAAEALRTSLALTLSLALLGVPACSGGESADTATPAASEAPVEAEAPAAGEGELAAEPLAGEAPAADPDVRVASDDLRALVAPIALYPDPLLELVLQGAAQPGQIVLADRFLDDHARDPSLQPDEAWDTAVLGLLNSPRVLEMMSHSLDWTIQLGQAVGDDLEGVQLAIQELRWSAYNLGILASNEWQDVVVGDGVVAILPAKQDQISVPEYDGVALLEAATPGLSFADGGASYGQVPAGGVVPAAATVVPVQFGAPQPSFWSTAAVFAGGAALGGLLGYAIGRNDNDDNWRRWRWYDDWNRRPWGPGWGSVHHHHHHYFRPAWPGQHVRPNRPIVRPRPERPGYDRPGRPGRPGGWSPPPPIVGERPGRPGRPEGTRPGRPEGTRPGRPEVSRPGVPDRVRPSDRPGLGDGGRPGVARPGVAPARPSRPVDRPSRDVSLPRPSTRPGVGGEGSPGARPADRPIARPADRPTARPADRPTARPADRPATRPAQRPATRPSRTPDRGGALARVESNPRVQQERARGAASRGQSGARQGGSDRAREAARPPQQRPRSPAMREGGARNEEQRSADRGRQSRQGGQSAQRRR